MISCVSTNCAKCIAQFAKTWNTQIFMNHRLASGEREERSNEEKAENKQRGKAIPQQLHGLLTGARHTNPSSRTSWPLQGHMTEPPQLMFPSPEWKERIKGPLQDEVRFWASLYIMGNFLWDRKPNGSEWMNDNSFFPNSRAGMTEEGEIDFCTGVKQNRGERTPFPKKS